MGRPRGYDRDTALMTALELFWERGYAATSISELERRTGLNRSSLYQEFGSKEELFEAALECYADGVIAMLLADLRRPDAGLDTVAALFGGLGALFRSGDAVATRGCLLVNSTAELAVSEQSIRPATSAYRDLLRRTFGEALAAAAARGELDADTVDGRAQILASTLMGVWLSVRIDPRDAAGLCDRVVDEVRSWHTPKGNRT